MGRSLTPKNIRSSLTSTIPYQNSSYLQTFLYTPHYTAPLCLHGLSSNFLVSLPFGPRYPLSLSLSLSLSVSMSFTFINLVLCIFIIIMKMMTMLQMYMLLAHPKPLLQLLAFHFPSFHYVGPFLPLVLRSVSILIIFSMLLVCFL